MRTQKKSQILTINARRIQLTDLELQGNNNPSETEIFVKMKADVEVQNEKIE